MGSEVEGGDSGEERGGASELRWRYQWRMVVGGKVVVVVVVMAMVLVDGGGDDDGGDHEDEEGNGGQPARYQLPYYSYHLLARGERERESVEVVG